MEVAVHIFILLLYCLLRAGFANSDTQIVPHFPFRTSIGGIHGAGGADKLLHASFPSEADTLAYVDALKHSNFSQWRSLEEVAKRAGGGSCSGAVNTSVLTALYLLGLFNLCAASPASCCIPPQTDRRRRRSFVPERSEDNAELPQLLDSLNLNLSSLSLEQFEDLPHVSSPEGGRIPVHISVVEQVRKLWDSNPRLLSNIHCRTATEAVRSSFISLSGVASGIILAYSIAQLNQCYPHQRQKEHYQNIWFFPIPRQTRLPNQQKVRSLPAEMPVKGEDDPEDGCDRTSVRMESGDCAKVFATEGCPYTSWVLLNRETGHGECVPRICFSGKVFVEFDQMCHDVNEPGFCPQRQRLYLTAWGEAVCDCIDGTFYGPDGNCHRLYEQAYCYKGTVLQFHKPSKTLVCKADSCQNLNSNLLDGELPYAKDKDGSCHQFSTIGSCETDQRYGFDVEALKPACVSLEQAGITRPPKSYQYSHMSFPSSTDASVPHYEVSYVILNGSTWELMMRTVGREKRDAQNSERKVIPFLDTREFPTNMEEILPGLEELGLIEGVKEQIKSNSENKDTLEEESVKSHDSLNSTASNLEKGEQENQRDKDLRDILNKKEKKPEMSMTIKSFESTGNGIANTGNKQLNTQKKIKRRCQMKEKLKGGKKRKRKAKLSLNDRSKANEKSSVKNWKTKHKKNRRNPIEHNGIKSTVIENGGAVSKLQSDKDEISTHHIIENKNEMETVVKVDDHNFPYHHQNSSQKSGDNHLKNIETTTVPDSKQSSNIFIDGTNKMAEVFYIKNNVDENSGQRKDDNEIHLDKVFTNLDQLQTKISDNKSETTLEKNLQVSYSLGNNQQDLSLHESIVTGNSEIDLSHDTTYQVINFSNSTYNDSVAIGPSTDNRYINYSNNFSVINGTNLTEQLKKPDNVKLTNLSENENPLSKGHQSEMNMNSINEYLMTPFNTNEDMAIDNLDIMDFPRNNVTNNAEHISYMMNINASKITPLAHDEIPKENDVELVQVSAIYEDDTTNLLNESQIYQVNASVSDPAKAHRSDYPPNENAVEYLNKIFDIPETNSLNRKVLILTKHPTLKSTAQTSNVEAGGTVRYCNTSEINILKSVAVKLGDDGVLQEGISDTKFAVPTTPSINVKSFDFTPRGLSHVSENTDMKATPITSSGLQLYFNEDMANNEETINKEDNRIHLIVEKRLGQILQESEMKQKSQERDLHKVDGIIKVHQTDLKSQPNVPSTVIHNRNKTMRSTKKKKERGRKHEHGTKKVGKGKRGRKSKKLVERKKNEVLQVTKEERSETSAGVDNSDKSSVVALDNQTLKLNKSAKEGNIEEDSLPDYLRNRDRRQAGSRRVGKTFPGIINAPLLNQCRPGAKRDYNGHCRPKVIPEDDVPAPRQAKKLLTQPVLPRIKCEGASRLDARGVCRTTFSGLG